MSAGLVLGVIQRDACSPVTLWYFGLAVSLSRSDFTTQPSAGCSDPRIRPSLDDPSRGVPG